MKTRKRENGKTRRFLYERHHCSGWFPMLISFPRISSYFLCKRAPSSLLMYLHFTAYSSQTWVSAASPVERAVALPRLASFILLTNAARYFLRLHPSAIWAETDREDFRIWSVRKEWKREDEKTRKREGEVIHCLVFTFSFLTREMLLTVRKFPLPLVQIACRYQSPSGIGFSWSVILVVASLFSLPPSALLM